jgi:hypothetical protein
VKPSLFLVLALSACTRNSAPEAHTSSGAGPEPAGSNAAAPASASNNDSDASSPSRYEARLLEVAKEYTAWGRVDDEVRWAPYLCRMPMPAQAYVSASKDDATHGDKLYSLFAKDRRAYVEGASAAGQVLVKESWIPARVSDPAAAPSRYSARVGGASPPDADHFHPYARNDDGQVFRATERAGLFIMLKLDDATPDTDAGWVYGTVTPRGEVTAAGRVASCMGCHVKAPRDRLFGLPGLNDLP